MFSKEIQNDYGYYTRETPTTIKLVGTFDKNFLEFKSEPVNENLFKVFESPNQTINFGIKLNNNTWIPKHIFENLKKAYEEGNPYYKPSDITVVDLNISGTLAFIDNKYNSNIETAQVEFTGSKSFFNLTAKVTQSVTTVTSTTNNKQQSRYELAGVQGVEYQFYSNNQPNKLNEENIINHILFIFEEKDKRITGKAYTQKYQNADGSVITENLPASTDIVKPATARVLFMDDYLRDVQR